jgi:hypothetical protein
MRYNRISMRANINAARKESGMASFLIVMIMMVVIR